MFFFWIQVCFILFIPLRRAEKIDRLHLVNENSTANKTTERQNLNSSYFATADIPQLLFYFNAQ